VKRSRTGSDRLFEERWSRSDGRRSGGQSEMDQEALDRVCVVDEGDDGALGPAPITGEYVELEDSHHELGPRVPFWARARRWLVLVRLRFVIAGWGLELVRWGSWNDELSPTCGWCENAVVGEDVDSRSRDLSDESFQEGMRIKQYRCCSVIEGMTKLNNHVSFGAQRDAIVNKRRAQDIPCDPLQLVARRGRNTDSSMQGEATDGSAQRVFVAAYGVCSIWIAQRMRTSLFAWAFGGDAEDGMAQTFAELGIYFERELGWIGLGVGW